MSVKEIDQLARSFGEFMAEHGLTQAGVARKVGVSSGVISAFLKGKYAGDCEGVARKIAAFMDSHARQQRNKHNAEFVQTSVAKWILTVIRQAEAFGTEREAKIGMIIGDSGHGKSVCLRQYGAVNPNSVYIELDDTMSSTAIFSEICKALRLDYTGTLKTLTKRLVESLAGRNMVVILDEASSLGVRELSQLRQVITVRCKCPLILAGNQQLLGTIHQPATRRGHESLDQFRSRIAMLLDLDAKASSEDGGGLYSADDIRKLYEYGGVKLHASGVEALRRIARTPQSGRLRTCSHIITACHMSPVVVDCGKIDAVTIVSAITQLGLPVLAYVPFTPSQLAEEATEATRVAAAG